MNLGPLLQITAAGAIGLVLCSCAEMPPYVEHPLAVFAPRPSGYWNDDGVSGPPKIVVHVSEQKAYFYKGKHVAGETTVSTAKLGFSTPPGHSRGVAKVRANVSTDSGD